MGWTIGQRWLGHPQSKIAKPKGCNSSVCRQTRLDSLMSDDVKFLHYSFSVEGRGRILREVIQSINLIIVKVPALQGLTYSKDIEYTSR